MLLKESSVNPILIKLMVMIWSVFTCWCHNRPSFENIQNCLKYGIFPDDWKKGNIVPIFKKGDKQNIKNYLLVSLLPICSKVFERIIYDNMLKYFLNNNLVTAKQFGFKPGDSCINQLLSITHDIFTSFDSVSK